MRAGRLARSVLTLQSVTEGTTSYGAANLEWAATGATFRGSIEQISGGPTGIGGGLQEEAEYEIRVRYDSSLTTRMRLVRSETSQTFEILRISNVDEKKHEMRLICREIV